jgi:hypothetical protein
MLYGRNSEEVHGGLFVSIIVKATLFLGFIGLTGWLWPFSLTDVRAVLLGVLAVILWLAEFQFDFLSRWITKKITSTGKRP